MNIRKRKRKVEASTWFNRIVHYPDVDEPTQTAQCTQHNFEWKDKHSQRAENKYERQSLRNFRRHGKWWKWRPYGTLSPVTYWKRTKKRLAEEKKALAQATSV